MFSKNEIDINNILSHVAIIMDGNGRWSKKKNLPKKAGHKAGADALEVVIKAADKIGIKHITVYAFSTENWKRSDEEVNDLMNLLRQYLKNYLNKAKKDNAKIDVIGDRTRLAKDIQELIAELELVTKDKQGINVHIALNYGGRDEILRAIRKIGNAINNNFISADIIDEKLLESYLDTNSIPDPELLIRTSGEQRISNFLLWQLAYTEFVFSDKLWPDFGENDLYEAIYKYQNRDRRFGGRNS